MTIEEEKELKPVEELDDDDGFTDEALPEPKEEEAVEAPAEAPAEETKVDEEPVEEVEEPEVVVEEKTYDDTLDDDRLQRIEDARRVWNKSYKKMARIKFAVSIVTLLGILAGWLIPTLLMRDSGTMPLYIGLGCAGAGIIILLVFGYFQRRHDKAGIADYFNVYFNEVNAYTLVELGATNIEGNVDNKITKEEFIEGGAFDTLAAIGSRDNITFQYKGMDCALAEAAGQVDAGKSLQTVFVGKYLRTHNACELSDEGLLIYFSGNDRALPPKKIETLHLTESSSRYKIYGASKDKKVLTHKVRGALAKIRTNKLLVDVTIVIKPGRTYWYLGYEDDIMVLPNDKPFNPQFVKEYKNQIAVVLEAAALLNGAE
ncbi:MAG: hypothetical protein IJS52_02520 [Bacilli bacterium]|nr:hypothetical protein [Bacilli bacterium]